MHGVKIFLFLVWIDINSIPIRLKGQISKLRSWWARFRYRKLYEEEKIWFCCFYFPVLVIRIFHTKWMARKMGLGTTAYLEQQTAEIKKTTVALIQRGRELEMENMRKFATLVPGATLNLYEKFTKERPFLSIRYLLSSIFR